MKKYADYFLIGLLALLQASFLPANLVLLLLLFWLFRGGVEYFLPRSVFAAAVLGILTTASIGLLLFVFSLVALVVFTLKNWLPQALFVRATLLILALPLSTSLYRALFFLWGGR
ncbi:MAG: hypothetical protein A3F35_02205 [Candidatus Woykebacteria bacterium RIFCSPHIGHO2_12_FULL_45_10]|uniref:Uncharacterized protein n=1 Tax=Candidatus Woykebacteria bacterium RIFCSPHIGHO2_12_FULL_45_10 TaxID=1802603 RepID=A0A1G1WPK2_9BACT|nr:MAG: hypothetical protein A3F35_02205 [Candidatus Woykebacteria bacterium RIFCSPHIGHO2_12_FULL_45_10]